MSRATSVASKVAKESATPTADRSKQQYLRFVYEPFPKPINCTTHTITKDIAAEPWHPLHIRIQRKLADFDPKRLHWRVVCPSDVSKKSFIRHWAAKRVRFAVAARLDDLSGTRVDNEQNNRDSSNESKLSTASGRDPDTRGGGDAALRTMNPSRAGQRNGDLTGALLIILPKDPKLALTADGQEIERSVTHMLRQVQAKWMQVSRRAR
ncbi:hypothetical protein BAUCODRAFT_149666 [Baudoinia panamericana UAMH 10762]|uniref:Uncharacterized protein n=1 Tax=Baudoinia panamericana (strain UAMH 10762) TaxID=717646 RepID=M2LJY7_BAUPA|nr:uncharacterized protein BAUCODRAFT_149666 [Baudoinia panamericana UAMH 10762]EMC94527.1 hypothetical protein BAUCODRAFT_149666 [Baudoinia panamericana UAMH 10762]